MSQIRGANYSATREVTLLVVALVAMVTAGCREAVEAPALLESPGAPADSLPAALVQAEPIVVSVTDSLARDSVDSDSLLAAIRDLSEQAARLEAAVAARQQVSAIGVAPDTSTPVDSLLLQPGARVRATARDLRFFVLRAFWAGVLIALAWMAIRAAAWLLERLAERNASRRLFYKKLIPIIRLLIWALTLYYVVSSVFAVDRAGLVAGTAALGVGIGFAAQGILKNIFGGLIIIFDQPFQVGDKIRVGGAYGEVVSIGMRATRIVTQDDNLVSVPNSQIVEGQVANANAGALDCQVVVDLYLPGAVDVARAKAIATSAAVNSPYVFLDKPVVVNVRDEFDHTFVTHLLVKAYVIDTRYEFALASDITETAKTEFLRQGLVTPATTAQPAAGEIGT